MVEDEDHHQDPGQREPGDGVFQVVVRDIKAGLPGLEVAPQQVRGQRPGGRDGVDLGHRHVEAGGPGHGQGIDVMPDVLGRIVGRLEPVAAAPALEEQDRLEALGTLGQGGSTRLRRRQRYPAELDQDRATVGQDEGRVEVDAGPLVQVTRRRAQQLAGQEAAVQADPSVLQVFGREDRRQLEGRLCGARPKFGDQVGLPGQALDLPEAEAEQDDQGRARDQATEKRRPEAAAAGAGHQSS